MQRLCTTLDICIDSNWAGCRKSRKRTSGGTVMLGRHCLKTWSKTQAIVAKSSAEAELYGVVRSATEGLGMVTLIKDMGASVGVQMHIDASAALGIIERQGLYKVRNIDTNVLWLQEVCARNVVPVKKVPGEQNPADLTTKNFNAMMIEKNMIKMNLIYQAGPAEKAAKLHALVRGKSAGSQDATISSILNRVDKEMLSIGRSDSESWSKIRKLRNDVRGGDRWRKSTGCNGIWHRWHNTLRVAMFTSFKVSKGPSSGTSLQSVRFTCGVIRSGEGFEIFDDWTRLENSHKVLDEPWVGYSVFTGKPGCNFDLKRQRGDIPLSLGGGRWADEE